MFQTYEYGKYKKFYFTQKTVYWVLRVSIVNTHPRYNPIPEHWGLE
jgi:hypothetical protein